MSDIESLKQENDLLKQQIVQANANMNSLLAQIEAHKQLINELTQGSLNMRAHCLVMQKQHQELNDSLCAANKKLEEVKPKD